VNLILASFDVLANAVFRSEAPQTAHLLRSYLINKVPLLLATLAQSMFPPVTSQYCITEALGQVDTNAFPTLSNMFDGINDVASNNNNTFTDSVRGDFCFACCLHGLIPETAIAGLLGDITYQTLPPNGRYIKEELVSQCMTDPERIQSLIGELDNMDGNVGAVCQALTDVGMPPPRCNTGLLLTA
jgi:mediator of RNA polymerase II transcription subunit 5